ncbi:MAG: hypothetical protein BRD55_01255 [Bacteroidetes bacterium SW_9_63_38]|nr:MAG: hypothetical protein BRD55_01255 [Bacteroidetes bacterium SW_9_63_38]
MTFNVPPSLGDASPQRTPLLALLERQAPDVLALQESRLRTGTDRQDVTRASASIRPLLGSSLGYAPPAHLPEATVVQQPVVGRLRLDSLSVHPLPPDGDTDARSRYTRTAFRWQGRPVVLYNVHLHTIGRARPWTLVAEQWSSLARWTTFLRTYREGALRRAQQARLLRRRIQRESHPVLVVGDFNSTPHQWAYRHLAQGLQNGAAWRVRGWRATFPATQPLVQIDHVLAGPAWQVTAARIPATGATGLSDHRPVVVDLAWKPQSP